MCPRGVLYLALLCIQIVAFKHDAAIADLTGLDVRESLIPDAGLGLFALSPFSKGDTICVYYGHPLTGAELDMKPHWSEYVFGFDSSTKIDASPYLTMHARYINDQAPYNVKFSPRPELWQVDLVATRDIAALDELYVQYGDRYWVTANKVKRTIGDTVSSPSSAGKDPRDDEVTEAVLRYRQLLTTRSRATAQHRPEMEALSGLHVAPSRIPGAGLGLFALRPFKQGDVLCAYVGEPVTASALASLPADRRAALWALPLSEQVWLDAGAHRWQQALYINDYDAPYNAGYLPEPSLLRVLVVALRDISAGEEIYLSYGEDYWRGHEHLRAKPTKHRRAVDDTQVPRPDREL